MWRSFVLRRRGSASYHKPVNVERSEVVFGVCCLGNVYRIMAPTRRKQEGLLARVNFPLYTLQMLTSRHVLVGGGGGSSSTGVANGFVSLWMWCVLGVIWKFTSLFTAFASVDRKLWVYTQTSPNYNFRRYTETTYVGKCGRVTVCSRQRIDTHTTLRLQLGLSYSHANRKSNPKVSFWCAHISKS